MKYDVDALIHPVRMRIIGALAMYGPQTPTELKKKLEHTPQATLYRNIQHLRDSNIIEIAESTMVRGNVEYTYKLNFDKTSLKKEQLMHMSAEDHQLLFVQYTAILNEYFRNYIADLQPGEHNASTMAMAPLYLSDEEFEELERDLQNMILSKTGKSPHPDRKPRLLSLVLLPELNME